MSQVVSQAQSSDALSPLSPGTTLLDDYTIVETVSHSATENVYLVVSARRCPTCGVENDGDAVQCGFCGTELPPAPRLRLTETRAPRDPRILPPASFVVNDCAYTFATQADAAQAQTRGLVFRYGMLTDPGLKRGALGAVNEDSMAAVMLDANRAHGQGLGLFLVADGVGGAALGEVASEIVLQSLVQDWCARILLPAWIGNALDDATIRRELQNGVANANARLMQLQLEHQAQIATTLTGVVLLKTGAYILNAGDSRTYLLRGDDFVPLTRDHSYVAMLVANGTLAPEEVYYHPQRNVILRSLGDVSAEADIFPLDGGMLDLRAGDRLLLCSDGLWEMVRDDEMHQVLRETDDAQVACARLVQLANAAGGADNISVIVICAEERAR